ncbi:MAG: hypothetical protein ACE14P_06125 [Methanotrichaceae archaeon]
MLVDSNDFDWAGSEPGDPLDPSFVGETMDMPLDLELILQAKAAGIIKESNPSATYLGNTPPEDTSDGTVSDRSYTMDMPGEAIQDVNVTGPWSLDLIALDQIMKHLNLALVQNRDAIIGYGTLNADNETHKIIVSGLQEGGRLELAVMPVDSQDLYKLDLSLDVHTTGTYMAYSANGAAWSGDVAGSAPPGILISSPETADAQGRIGSTRPRISSAKNAAADKSLPIRLGKGKL